MSRNSGFLIVSDLHLSSGRDAETGHVSRTEDFLFDDEFCAFLDHHMSDTLWQEIEWTLAIDGDFMDFLQVSQAPKQSGHLRSDSIYGLKAGPDESAWKLERIIGGHESFFEKLAEFVQNHRLLIVTGNHDIEFNYPEVQKAFIEELARIGNCHPELIESRVDFRSWFHFDGDVYIEHGNQYDSFNSFRSMLEPRLPETNHHGPSNSGDVELPPGSLFVRYLFNRVETDSPFADNIKPASRFLAWVTVNHPLRSLGFLFSDGREMLRRLREKWRLETPDAYRSRDIAHQKKMLATARALADLLPRRSTFEWESTLNRIHQLQSTPSFQRRGARSRRWLRMVTGPIRTPILLALLCLPLLLVLVEGILPMMSGLLPAALLYPVRALDPLILPAVTETARWLTLVEVGLVLAWFRWESRPGRQRMHLRKMAAEIQRETGARVVVMGHTHEPDLWPLDGGAQYFNLGTWTKVFSREDRVIREEKELTFLRILPSDKGPKSKILKWEGQRGEARLAYIFEDWETVLKT
jgi:UDP-2,3-diacylglucosamine pyrophosphatase LpxH